MAQAGLQPDEEINLTEGVTPRAARLKNDDDEEEDLGVFTDFVEGLDLDSLLGN